MKNILVQERDEIIDDLISYYRFLKRDTRNHFFNALIAKKNINKQSDAKKIEINQLNESLLRIQSQYKRLIINISMILRMKYDWNHVPQQTKKLLLGKLIWHYQENGLRSKKLHLRRLSRLIRNAEDKNKISEYRNIARDVKNSYYIIKKKLAIAISLRRNEILKGIELDE
ncbi:hypothetical protein IKO18_06090 [bacterium]|nr:hypothetical protein [bacterium]